MTDATKTILMIVPQPFLEWRGSPLRVNATLRALSGIGFKVDLLAMPFGETPDDLPPGVRVLRPRNLFGRKSIPIGPSAWKAIYDCLLAREASRLLARNQYVALHGVEEAGAIAVRLARGRGIPVVFEKHSDPDSYRRRGIRNLVMSAYARVELYAMRGADAVVVTGPGLAEDARRLVPGKAVHSIFDLPSSVREADQSGIARVRSKFGFVDGEPVAAYAGSFAVYQGIDLLWRAIPMVLDDLPAARFLIVGGTEEEISSLRARFNNDARVCFAGRVPPEQLPDYLGAADILLSPRGSGRNTPLKVLDYLKAGRPIVAVNSEANLLVLDQSVARLPPAEVREFAGAITGLMRDEEKRGAMGREARRLLAKNFSFAEFSRRLEKCYADIGISPERGAADEAPPAIRR